MPKYRQNNHRKKTCMEKLNIYCIYYNTNVHSSYISSPIQINRSLRSKIIIQLRSLYMMDDTCNSIDCIDYKYPINMTDLYTEIIPHIRNAFLL